MRISVDGYPHAEVRGAVDSLAPGGGAAFSLIPADNATGNFVRVVQRVPVEIRLTSIPSQVPLVPGLSARVSIRTVEEGGNVMQPVVIDPDRVAPVNTRTSHGTMPTLLVVAGIVFAALTEAVTGTVLSTARLDIIGDTYATLDQFALLEAGYTAAKLTAFVLTPWLIGRLSSQTCLRAATGIMTLVGGAAALTYNFDTLVVLRLLQGLAGGVLLVCGQTLLFQTFSRSLQPVVQCFFAFGAVVTPATLMPYMQGGCSTASRGHGYS